MTVQFQAPVAGGLWHDWKILDTATVSSSFAQPTHVFPKEGTYGVICRTGLPNGAVDSTFFTVEVYGSPGKSYRFLSDTVCLGEVSHFQLDTLGRRNLDFRVSVGGQTLLADSAAYYHYRFTQSGAHTVQIITRHRLTQCIDTSRFTVWVNPRPQSVLNVSDSVGCTPFQPMLLLPNSADSLFLWRSRFGLQSLPANVSTSLLTPALMPGTDSLRLIRVNAFGCRDTSSVKILRSLERPQTAFSLLDTQKCAFLALGVQDHSLHANQLLWDFGDSSGVQSSGAGGFFYHRYGQSGTYYLKQIASNGYCSDTLIKPQGVQILPAPRANIGLSLGVDSLLQQGLVRRELRICGTASATVRDSSQGAIDSVVLRYDGQRISSGSSLVFSGAGIHLLSLQAYGSTGCLTTDTVFVRISSPPTGSIQLDTARFCGKSAFYIRASTNTQADSLKVGIQTSGQTTWNYRTLAQNGWDTTQISQSSTINYRLIRSSGVCRDTLIGSQSLGVRPPTQAVLRLTDTAVCVGRAVQFLSLSSEADTLRWSVQPPGSSSWTTQNAGITPTIPGLFSVRLAASNLEGCRDTAQAQIRVLARPVLSLRVRDTARCGSRIWQVQVDSTGLAGDSLQVQIGNQAFSTAASGGIWRYTASANESTVPIRVRRSNGLCDTVYQQNYPNPVRALPSILTLQGSPVLGCVPKRISFSLGLQQTDSLEYAYASGNYQSLGAVNSAYSWSDSLSSAYQGAVRWRLKSVEGCMIDTVLGQINLYPRLQAQFVLQPDAGCQPLRTQLSAQISGADSLLWWTRIHGSGRQNLTAVGQNLTLPFTWTQNDSLQLRIQNQGCVKDTAVGIRITGLQNDSTLVLRLVQTDSLSGQERHRLLWDSIPGADHYRIYRGVDPNSLRFLGETRQTQWWDEQWSVTDSVFYRVEGEDSCGNRRYGQAMSNLVLKGSWQDESRLEYRLESQREGGVRPPITARKMAWRGMETAPESANLSPIYLDWDSVSVSIPLNRLEKWDVSAGSTWQLGRQYRLSVTNSAGDWAVSNSVLAYVSPRLFLPDAFTPDQDGLNDSLRPLGMGLMRVQMQIWNRWGEQIFTGEGQNAIWDGRIQGQAAPEGLYTVIIEAMGRNREPIRVKRSVWVVR